MEASSRAPSRRVQLAALGLSLLKLWLVSAVTVSAYGMAGHDDRLFLNQAHAILQGEWLGRYGSLTLVKGPGFPLFLALSNTLGLSLPLAQHLLYLVICWVTVRALAPLWRRSSLDLVLFAVLAFNPVTYTSNAATRVLREGIYASLCLLVFACAAALAVRWRQPARRLWAWSVGLGLGLAAYWVTREEREWMLPTLAVLVGLFAAARWFNGRQEVRATAALLLTPAAIVLAAVLTVCTLNQVHYGLFTTVEFKHPDFLRAYGALSRVRHAQPRDYVPVPEEARQRIYAVSPAFAELRKYLEGDLRGWHGASCGSLHVCDDYAGGWFMWALRDAVELAGLSHTAPEAMGYYRRLADEVDAACERGALDCGPARATMTPVWRNEYLQPILATAWNQVRFVLSFGGFTTEPMLSRGTDADLAFYRELTIARLTPRDEAGVKASQSRLESRKLRWLGWIGHGYQRVLPWAILLALAGWVAATGVLLRRRRGLVAWVIGSLTLGTLVLRAILLSMIEVTSFLTTQLGYLSPAAPFGLVFSVVGIWLGAKALVRKPVAAPATAPATPLVPEPAVSEKQPTGT